MSVKSLQIYDIHCQQTTPCDHQGRIEKLDGSFYEGPISSGIAYAILSNISLDCVNVRPDKSMFSYDSGSDMKRKFNFFIHVVPSGPYNEQPLSKLLEGLPFQINNQKLIFFQTFSLIY